ncbi:MAG: universal stress protein [Brevibacterium sp.]
MDQSPARIVVGIVDDQPAEVLTTAADYARRFDAELILAQVDDSKYTVEVRPDGTVASLPLDPDLIAEAAPDIDAAVLDRVTDILESQGVKWSTQALAGASSQELSRLAEAVDAVMIIVGVRKAGIKGSLHEFFNGSVAIQLAHRQHRPLVVVPLAEGGME